MWKIIYLCGVSGAGKTSIVQTLENKTWYLPIYFSGEMKRIGLEKWYIDSPEAVYKLDVDLRQKLEDMVREHIEAIKSTTSSKIVIDGHLMIDWPSWIPKPTFSLEQWRSIDHIIFLYCDPANIVKNRVNRAYRSISNEVSDIIKIQETSIARSNELLAVHKHITCDIVEVTKNDMADLIDRVSKIID
jgi:adenylate kinase